MFLKTSFFYFSSLLSDKNIEVIEIFNIDIQDEIIYNQESKIDNSMKISDVDDYKFNLDTIFINEKYTFDKKEYFRIFVRPNLSRQNNFDYFRTFFTHLHNQEKTTVNFKGGAIKFYIKTLNGTETIKIGKDDILEIPAFSIEAHKDQTFKFTNFDFVELKIPASFIEQNNEITILYSASYNAEGWKIKNHNTVGTIEINRSSITEHTNMNNNYKVDISNKAFGVFHNDFKSSQSLFFYNILRESINLEIIERGNNIIDPKINLSSSYSKWESTDNKLLGKKMESFFELYLKGLNRTNSLKSIPTLQSEGELSKYYSVKKIEDNITIKNNKYEIVTNAETEYYFPANIVKDSQKGTKGILINPLNKNDINFNRKIEYNSNLLNLNYIISKEFQNSYYINYENALNNYSYQSVLEYKADDLVKIGYDNKNEVIKFIYEKEENS